MATAAFPPAPTHPATASRADLSSVTVRSCARSMIATWRSNWPLRLTS